MDGTRIGDKPGLESCVVSQVVADTLARLPLEGCRGWLFRRKTEVDPRWCIEVVSSGLVCAKPFQVGVS